MRSCLLTVVGVVVVKFLLTIFDLDTRNRLIAYETKLSFATMEMNVASTAYMSGTIGEAEMDAAQEKWLVALRSKP